MLPSSPYRLGYNSSNSPQRLKEMKAMTRQAPSNNKRKTEKSEMISLNLQSSDGPNRSSTASTSASKPKAGGFSDALRKDPTPTNVVASANDGKTEDTANEEKWEERPLMWDELDEVEAIVDLDTRPAGMQKVVDLHAAYVEHRHGGMIDQVWQRIEELKRQSVK